MATPTHDEADTHSSSETHAPSPVLPAEILLYGHRQLRYARRGAEVLVKAEESRIINLIVIACSG